MGAALVCAFAAAVAAWSSSAILFAHRAAAEGAAAAAHLDTKPIEVVEPSDYRMTDFRSPVPKTLKGAEVLDAAGALRSMEAGAVMIDVYPRAPKPPNMPKTTIWRSPRHKSIEGAAWLPNVGYGKLAEAPESYLRHALERLSGGDKAKPLVFFCLKDCWMSWNAAKRAIEWGYTRVAWFPDGTDGWQEIGRDIVDVEPEPGPDGTRPE
ncbi:MAG: PQQ-dependent catabolism-associated CXXCW motif protein [Hyphomicrobiaceae bacterium]